MDPQEFKLIVVGIIGIAVLVLGIGVPVIWGFRAHRAAADRALQRIYEDLNLLEAAKSQEPKVGFVYHTYSGILVWSVQCTHRIEAPYEVAEVALRRFLGYTLKWGTFAYGGLLIVPLALGNYLVQKGKIRRQHASRLA